VASEDESQEAGGGGGFAVRRSPGHRSLGETVLWGLVGYALVFLVALGSHRSSAVAGRPQPLAGLEAGFSFGFFLFLVCALAGLCLIAYLLLVGGGRRRRPDYEQYRELPLSVLSRVVAFFLVLLVPVTLLAVLLLSNGSAPEVTPITVSPGMSVVGGGDSGAGAATGVGFSWWWMLGVLSVALVGGVAILLVRWRLGVHHRSSGEGLEMTKRVSARQAALEVLAASLEDLRREPDPRRAVIRAYLSAERLLGRHGLGRQPHEAPLEYLSRWLRALGTSASAGERLTWLFQRARFSPHAIDSNMKAEAIAAFSAVCDELERGET